MAESSFKMSIYKTVTYEYEFAEWIKQSDSYSKSFSFEGAVALQKYIEELSDEIGEPIEFDPIAWCCEFTEYDNFEDFKESTSYHVNGILVEGYDNIKSLDDLKDNTNVIEFDKGIIVQDF